MSKEALDRIAKFTAIDGKKRAKANKKAIKKLDKRSKMSPKAQVKKAHDKIEDKLNRLSKKYGVSIKLNRNKKKMPSVIVSGLKKLSYGDSAKLFSEIPHSSPVPQKMNGNSALFRVFTKRKITASDKSRFVITASRGGKRMFWTNEGFKEVKASEASRLGEELADKIERRAKAKGWDAKTVPAQMTALDLADASTYTLKVNDSDGSLWQLLEYLKKCGSDGHSVSFTIDDQSFGFDGDGADKIYELNKGAAVEADDGDDSSTDNSSDNGSDNSDDSDDSEDDSDDETDEEVEANKKDIVEFVNKNGLNRDDLIPLTKQALDAYSSDVLENAPVEDLVDLIYDMLGKDDTKNGIRTLANKKAM